MDGLTWSERAGARLRYRRMQLRRAWYRLTGRCHGCGYRRDQHRFGCDYRPGKGARLSMRER